MSGNAIPIEDPARGERASTATASVVEAAVSAPALASRAGASSPVRIG